ncbi:unnamed protein product, partial [Polarella glacialis]
VLERDTVIFSVECHTRMGEEVLLVGSTPELGCWDLAGAVRMTTNSEDFPTWTSSPIPRLAIGRTEANPVGYKYVLSRGAEGATWEQGPDRSIGLDELLGLSEEGSRALSLQRFKHFGGSEVMCAHSQLPTHLLRSPGTKCSSVCGHINGMVDLVSYIKVQVTEQVEGKVEV